MLALLVYPLRKRMRWVRHWGPLKHWFRFHMVAGILGPLLVVFHSTFRVGSLNAGVALVSLSLVVASGLVGRFLYRRIHHGLYGSLATLGEIERGLELELAALEPMLDRLPAVDLELGRFTRLVTYRPRGLGARAWHFLTLGPRRALLAARLRRTLLESTADQTESLLISRAEISQTLARTDHALRTLQRCAQFRTYERLFSLWHVIHIPFLWMLVITAIVHVVAVHAY